MGSRSSAVTHPRTTFDGLLALVDPIRAEGGHNGCRINIDGLGIHRCLHSMRTSYDACEYNAWIYRLRKTWRREVNPRGNDSVQVTRMIMIFSGTATTSEWPNLPK